jgi:hypothetical protein
LLGGACGVLFLSVDPVVADLLLILPGLWSHYKNKNKKTKKAFMDDFFLDGF